MIAERVVVLRLLASAWNGALLAGAALLSLWSTIPAGLKISVLARGARV